MADDGDCLSDLPDDLLRRILQFAPAKEGASTGALARRWRLIWPSSGAVNIDSRSYDHLNRYRRRDVVMRDANDALAAAGDRGGPVTKFTFRYEEGQDGTSNSWDDSMYDDDMYMGKRDMARGLHDLLYSYSPAARHIEELSIGLFYGPRDDGPTGLYDLSIRLLSCSPALRVLHLTKCMDYDREPDHLTATRRVSPPFPRLAELRLRQCAVTLSILQAVIDAAPCLATLHLDGVAPRLANPTFPNPTDPPAARFVHLSCPKVTTLVLANLCCWGHQWCRNTLEVDAPLLRCFAYQGPIRSLSLKSSSPPDMARVDLRFHVPAQAQTQDGTCRLFWKLVRNFSGASNVSLNFQLSENTFQGDYCY